MELSRVNRRCATVVRRVPEQRTKSWYMRLFMMCLSRLAFVLITASCWGNYWGRRRIDQPTPIRSDDPVWIWANGGVEKWHAVVITQHHVSGIPYRMSVYCDSCWRSIPRAQVDSIKIGYRTFAENAAGIARAASLVILAELAVALGVNSLR